MLYSKILHGWVEAVYTFDGDCIKVKFVQDDSKPIDRRILRQKSDGPQQPDEFEHDELIDPEQYPQIIEDIECKEKHVDIELVQPIRSKKPDPT